MALLCCLVMNNWHGAAEYISYYVTEELWLYSAAVHPKESLDCCNCAVVHYAVSYIVTYYTHGGAYAALKVSMYIAQV